MKGIVTSLLVIGLTVSVFAQSPQKLSYQAVIRNSSGALVTNHAVGMRISILQGTMTGTVVYAETYSPVPQTNANGLVTVEIGSGTPSTGTFSGINWSTGPYFLKTETDPAGGTSYTITGTSQLLSVPYALYSETSESIADNSVTSAKIVNGTIVATDLANNSVTTDKINSAAVTGAKIAQAGATTGQALKWNGTTWAPGNDLSGSSLWTQSGAKIYYNTGNVGVGISDPLEKLHVNGSVLLSTGDKKLLLFTQGTGEDIMSTNTLYINHSNNKNVSIGEGGTSNLLVSGRVGVGTTNPAGFLNIQGNSTADIPHLLLTESATDYARLSFKNTAAPTKNWSIAGMPDATDANSRLNFWYWNGTTGRDIISISGNGTVTAGLGVSLPGTFLEVHSNVTYVGGITPVIRISDNFKSWNIGLGSDGDRFTVASQDMTERLTILKSNGNVGIGTISPAYKMDIAGPLNLNKGLTGAAIRCNGAEALWFDGTYFSWGWGGTYNFFGDKVFIGPAPADPGTNHLVVNGTAAKPGGGSWATWSDLRLKNIHGLYKKGLKEIVNLQPILFSYKNGNNANLPADIDYAGLVAQEVRELFPEAVSKGADGYLQLDIHPVNMALINAVKELKAENNELKARLEAVENLLRSEFKK